jgi:hypothetical protein
MSEGDGASTIQSREDIPNSVAQRDRLAALSKHGTVGWLAHRVTAGLELHGVVSAVALQAGVDQVVRRRPALRSRFQLDRDYHRIADAASAPVSRVVVQGSSSGERWAKACALARTEAYRPMPAGRTPLLSATTYDAADRQLLLLSMDQLACDAWSANLLVADLVAAADRSARGLPSLTVQPDRYERAWRARCARASGADGLAAVTRRRAALEGHTLHWPLEWERNPHQTDDLVERVVALDQHAAAPFLRRIRTCGGSVFAATALAFATIAGLRPADRVALTSTFACRETIVEEGVVGWFSNEVAIPLPPLSGTVSEALATLRDRLVAALNDQTAPLCLVAPEQRHPETGPTGVTVSLLYLPSQLAGADQTSMRIGDATADRRRVTICPTGADVDLFVIEQPITSGGPVALTLGAMSGRGGLGGQALDELLSRWRAAVVRLGRMDWRTDQLRLVTGAAS